MALQIIDNSVFLHIPKTGGNWIREILEKLNLAKKEIGHKHTDINNLFSISVTGEKQLIKYFIKSKFDKKEKIHSFFVLSDIPLLGTNRGSNTCRKSK